MGLDEITPVILTYNEEPNLERCLDALRAFPDVVVLDSGSSDGTLEIAKRYSNARVLQRTFDTHANQWNYAVRQARTEWILSLDADYRAGDRFLGEVAALELDNSPVAFCASFRYFVSRRPLRRSVLPPRAVLFDRSRSRYVDDGHTQSLEYDGPAGQLRCPVDHDDRKGLDRWLWAQGRYASLEAVKLAATPDLGWVDRIRKWKWLAPFAVFGYTMFVTGGIRDGRRGLYYAQQRMIAEAVLSLHLLESDLNTEVSPASFEPVDGA